jgi:N-acetylglucosamine kinase-like BadF-type ATPase
VSVDGYVCGADAGGTKTACVVASRDGEILARTVGRGVAFHGPTVRAGMLDGLTAAVVDACLQAEVDPLRLNQLVVGLAGVDDRHHELEAARALRAWLPATAIEVVNDASVALEATVVERPAMILMAGTGSIAYGESTDGAAARVGGWGHVFGDEGSAYAIAVAGLRAVLREVDGRGAATLLTPAATRHFSLEEPAGVVSLTEVVSADPAVGASYAREVFAAWAAGDEVAADIIHRAADTLTEMSLALLHQLRVRPTVPVPVALAGTVLLKQPEYASLVAEGISSQAPNAVVSPADGTPVLGAALRALRLSAAGTDMAQLLEWRLRLAASFERLDETTPVAPVSRNR